PAWEQMFESPAGHESPPAAPTPAAQPAAPAPATPAPVATAPVAEATPSDTPVNAGLAAATKALANAPRVVLDSEDDEEETPSPEAAANFTAAVQNLDSSQPTSAFTSDFGLDGEPSASSDED